MMMDDAAAKDTMATLQAAIDQIHNADASSLSFEVLFRYVRGGARGGGYARSSWQFVTDPPTRRRARPPPPPGMRTCSY